MDRIDKIHDWIESKRLINRVSYKKMGEAIGYTDTGFKKAIKNKRLSITHLEEIINKFDLRTEYLKYFDSNSVNEPTPEHNNLNELALMVVENEDDLMQVKIFSNLIEKRVAKRLVEIASSKDKLLEFLK